MSTDFLLPDGVPAQLEKILSSPSFGAGSQASRLLRYVVEKTLDGHSEEIKESVLGVEVFGRESFDPRIDPIVRVEASRLRQKLASYYESEGKEDQLRIILPKRGYVPLFEPVGNGAAAPLAPVRSRSRWRNVAWSVTGLFVVATAALGIAYWRLSPQEGEVLKLSILPPDQGFAAEAANISPNGRMLAFTAQVEGRVMLWVRPLDSLEGHPVPGTEFARFPFWSADSRSVGFFSGTKLKRVEISGGAVQTICDAPSGMGGAWNRDGVIVFAPDSLTRLYRVPAAGGTPEPVTDLDTSNREFAHRWPQFLPDGKHFLYLARSRQKEHDAIYLSTLGSRERTRLVSTNGSGAWTRLRTGGFFGSEAEYLLYFREGSLVGQKMDARRFQPAGEPFPIARPIRYGPSNARTDFSVSENGVLAYSSAPGSGQQLVWRDRTGKVLSSIDGGGSLSANQGLLYISAALSPDERAVATGILDRDAGYYYVWLIDVETGTPSRFTFQASRWPVWSPDGKRIAFNMDRTGSDDLFVKPSNGASEEQLLLSNSFRKIPSDWSNDGKLLLFDQEDPKTKRDIWILPLDGNRKPYPILQTGFNEYAARFSPDGHSIAYTSDESGQEEIYVQRFPLAGAKRKISHHGGSFPEWRRDGRELFFISADRQMMSAPLVDPIAFTFDVPKALFPVLQTAALSRFSVIADGQRFLMNMATPVRQPPVTVVTNWSAGIH